MVKLYKVIAMFSILVAGLFSVSQSTKNINAATPMTYTSLYDSNGDLSYTGDDLRYQLTQKIANSITKKWDYGNLNTVYKTTDVDLSNSGNVILYYTGESFSWNFSSFSGTVNREHVWPKSTGLWDTSGGGSDMHHIRPTDSKINSTRGNLVFGEVSGGKTATGNNGEVGGYYGGGVFEPLDEVKGDVARIIMYMFVHYNSPSTLGSNTNKSGNCPTTASSRTSGNLPLTNVFNGSKTNAFNLLLEWHNDDPVDEIEINRNEAVYKIQGNRNPFIDKPDYANYIWG